MYFERPDNMAQALSALTSSKAKALAGGTNIMVDIKKGRETGKMCIRDRYNTTLF